MPVPLPQPVRAPSPFGKKPTNNTAHTHTFRSNKYNPPSAAMRIDHFPQQGVKPSSAAMSKTHLPQQ
jgi:hypothetical protein